MSNATIFLSDNEDELYDRLRSKCPEKQNGNDTNRFVDGIVSIVDKVLVYERISLTQHKKEQKKFDNAYVFSLMHKLISRSKDSDELSLDFHRDNTTREKHFD